MEKTNILLLKHIREVFIALLVTRHGDIIQFIQDLFGLSFQESMQKINIDFNLNLKNDAKIDIKKIKEIENIKKKKQLEKQVNLKKYIDLSEKYRIIYKNILQKENEINILNWESIRHEISIMQDRLNLLEIELECLEKKI